MSRDVTALKNCLHIQHPSRLVRGQTMRLGSEHGERAACTALFPWLRARH